MPIANPDGFQRFWRAYPRKVGRLAAAKAWNRLKPDDEFVAKMIRAVKWQERTEQWTRGFIPHPTTWLSQGRWDDEPDRPPGPPVRSADWTCPHQPACDERWRCHVKESIEEGQP